MNTSRMKFRQRNASGHGRPSRTEVIFISLVCMMLGGAAGYALSCGSAQQTLQRPQAAPPQSLITSAQRPTHIRPQATPTAGGGNMTKQEIKRTALFKKPVAGIPLRMQPLFAAIAMSESSGGKYLVGDGGQSLGCYHIQRAYWNDALEYAASLKYDSGVYSRSQCQQIMMWYWQRYCPRELAAYLDGNDAAAETLARVHNAGSAGRNSAAADQYWTKTKGYLHKGTQICQQE